MNTKQRGFIDIPKGVFETLFFLAVIGLLSSVGALFYLLWWLFTNVQITIGG